MKALELAHRVAENVKNCLRSNLDKVMSGGDKTEDMLLEPGEKVAVLVCGGNIAPDPFVQG